MPKFNFIEERQQIWVKKFITLSVKLGMPYNNLSGTKVFM